jgi:large subunit ribosomal protein L15
MPLTRRVPKRGFTNPFRVESQIVRLDALALLPEAAEVTTEALVAAGIIRESKGPAKLLATGALTRPVTVRGLKLSAGARERIIAAGGTVHD